MNILPKKNWHVRKKENIARVRRDEAEAAEKEKENERRIKLAEQEARIAFMRQTARERDGTDSSFNDNVASTEQDTKVEADIYTSAGNINFFKEAEMGGAKTGTNKEHEIEKKEEKEAYEKKIGLLTYLGQDSLEATGKIAWYAERDHVISKVRETEEEIGLKSKVKMDPLNEIMKCTGMKIYPKIEKTSQEINFPSSLDKIFPQPKSKNLCRKDKKHKDKKHKKRKRRHSSLSDDSPQKRKKKHSLKRKSKKRKIKLESSEEEEESEEESEEEKQIRLNKLREERLKREARERKREERLLSGKDPDVEEKKPKVELPYKQKYNAQFNPQLAKQNKEQEVVQPALQPGVKYWLS